MTLGRQMARSTSDLHIQESHLFSKIKGVHFVLIVSKLRLTEVPASKVYLYIGTPIWISLLRRKEKDSREKEKAKETNCQNGRAEAPKIFRGKQRASRGIPKVSLPCWSDIRLFHHGFGSPSLCRVRRVDIERSPERGTPASRA